MKKKKLKAKLTLIIIRWIVHSLLSLFLVIMRIEKRKQPLYFAGDAGKAKRVGVWCNELLRFAAYRCGVRSHVVLTIAIDRNMGGFMTVSKWPPDVEQSLVSYYLDNLAKQHRREFPYQGNICQKSY
jgi:hypothetical protein